MKVALAGLTRKESTMRLAFAESREAPRRNQAFLSAISRNCSEVSP
jgi:hypothetical protein